MCDIIYVTESCKKESLVDMFSEKFKKLRQSQGLTQVQMADKLEVSPSAIGMYEQGRRKPDSDMLKKICQMFNVSVDYLLDVSVNSEAEEKSVTDFIDEITYTLRAQKGLMFNGKPITARDKEKIAQAIKLATAIAVSSSGLED